LDLFLEKGYAGTPLRMIAQAADVTTPALYWYYRSKDDLCFSIVAREYREFRDLVEAAIESGSPEKRLREYVAAFVSVQLRRRKGSMKLGFDQLVASLPPDQQARVAQLQRPLLDVLRDILRSGQELGVFSVVDVTLTAFAIISVSNYVFTWYRPEGPLTIDEIAEGYADLAVRFACGRERGPVLDPRVRSPDVGVDRAASGPPLAAGR
jgi:AcrR family transcriptional regulator